ncbi:hypothetical protein D7B24_004425, partial [Verticillium nonalfalfae]
MSGEGEGEGEGDSDGDNGAASKPLAGPQGSSRGHFLHTVQAAQNSAATVTTGYNALRGSRWPTIAL